MKQNEIALKVFNIVEKVLENNENLPKNNDEDITALFDSIRFVTLIVEIENTFGIEISDDDFELEKMSSINKITELILPIMKE